MRALIIERCLHVKNAMIKRSNVLCCTFCEDARPYIFVQLETFLKLQLAIRACLGTLWYAFGLLDNPDFELAALVADGAVQTAVKPSWR